MPTKFEYCFIYDVTGPQGLQRLNEAGAAGWQVVGLAAKMGPTEVGVALLKRELVVSFTTIGEKS